MNLRDIILAKFLIGKGGGASSWNDLTDKPTTISGGDTLTWDGNTEGLVLLNIGQSVFKVSDAAPTMADLENGATIKYSDSLEVVECDVRESMPGLILIEAGSVLVIGESVAGTEIGGIMFPEAGTYLYKYVEGDGQYVTSLTIPGYTGFGKEVLKPEVLPEHSHKWNDIVDRPFGETVVKGDTLTFVVDKSDAIVSSGDLRYCYVSDGVITPEMLSNAYTIKAMMGGETQELPFEGGSFRYPFGELSDKVILFGNDMFNCVLEDNHKIEGTELVFPKKGIYMQEVAIAELVGAQFSLTIPGYNGFETTTIQPIETKYLPEHLHFGTETKLVEGDTLTWDGNTEGRTVVDMGGYPLVHVSDAVVTAKDVSNGYSMEIVPDGVREFPSDFAQEITDNVLLLNDETFLICCSADNCEVSAIGLVFPKRGVYFMGGEYSIKSLTIPGYTGFVSKQTVVTPLAEQYMPILTSPSGKKFKLSVDDSGAVTATEVIG